MIINFLLLANSYKNGKKCVAGLNIDSLEYVRLGHGADCDGLDSNELKVDDIYLSELDLVEVEVEKLKIIGCQTENYELIEFKKYIKRLTYDDLNDLYYKIPKKYKYIFMNTNYCLTKNEILGVHRSLMLVKVESLEFVLDNTRLDRKKTYLNFYYGDNQYTDFRITCDYDKYNNSEAFLLVSMPSKLPDGVTNYYKFISSIIHNYVEFEL